MKAGCSLGSLNLDHRIADGDFITCLPLKDSPVGNCFAVSSVALWRSCTAGDRVRCLDGYPNRGNELAKAEFRNLEWIFWASHPPVFALSVIIFPGGYDDLQPIGL